MKKIVRIISITLLSSLIATGACIGLGFALPLNAITPFWIELNKKEYQGAGDDLLLGNEHMYMQSPFLACLGTSAWNLSDCLYGLKTLSDEGKSHTIHYEVYSQEEREKDPSKNQVGFYALENPTKEKKPFIVTLAGGGFTSVCTPFESLPVASKFHELGYPSFCLTYRIGKTFGTLENATNLMDDISASLSYIIAHADTFNVDSENYYIVGFSAGAMASSMWCLNQYGFSQYALPSPKAACLMYGYNEDVLNSESFVPSFIRMCKNDPYFTISQYQELVDHLQDINIKTDHKLVDCLHGFGLGTSTEAEGWVEDAIEFFKTI